MLSEGRKRDAAANALLGIAFAANAAQSPKDLVRSGNIEGPGVQLMSRMMQKRKEANRNLDSARVSHPARNKTFKEFVEEAYLIEGQSRENAEKKRQQKENPDEWVLNNTASSDNPNWRLKKKSSRGKQSRERNERIKNLSTEEERAQAERKKRAIVSKGKEAHHITPTHHSAKLKSSMSDDEWRERVARDAKIGVYHGHHPRNLMAAKKSTDAKEKPGVYHRKGGAHEIEGKVKDLVSGPGSRESAISHRDLLNAAIRMRKRNETR